jgi:hypothetical protein
MADDMHEHILNPHFEKFAGPLGHVILEFNYLEADAARTIARLLCQDDVTAAVIAAIIPFLDKVKLIDALASFKVQDAEMRQEFRAIVKDATDINALRNRYVHSEYLPLLDANDNLIQMLHQRLKDHGKSIDPSQGQTIDDLLKPIDVGTLKKLASDTHSLGDRMKALAERFVDRQP